jgi:DNA-binding response OmpR family regulator
MKNILVIDDEPSLAEICELILMREGYSVTTANCGIDGINEAKKQIPDLIFLDWVMPDINGDEVFKRLRADSTTQSIPVVLMSALPEAKSESLILGAKSFLPKPFNADKLINLARSILTTRKIYAA